MRKQIRRRLDICLTGLGVGVIFTAVILSASLSIKAQMPLALIGVLLMEAGVWGLSNKLLPNERRFVGLRAEGDTIIGLMRELNAAALARDSGDEGDDRFQSTLDEMHASVARMADLASKDVSAIHTTA